MQVQMLVESRDADFPGARVIGSCELPDEYPLTEWQVLLTAEPFLQPCVRVFYYRNRKEIDTANLY